MTQWNEMNNERSASELKTASAAILIMRTIEGEVIKVNDRACEVMQSRAEKLLGRHWQEHISAEALPSMMEVMDTLISSGVPQQTNETWVRPDGVRFRTRSFYSLMSGKSKETFVMCESFLIDQEVTSSVPSFSLDDELRFIAENLEMLCGLAARSELDVLAYTMRMAFVEVKKELEKSRRYLSRIEL